MGIKLKCSLGWLPPSWGLLGAPSYKITPYECLPQALLLETPLSQNPVHPHPVSDFVQLMMLLPNPPDADHASNTYSSTTLHGLQLWVSRDPSTTPCFSCEKAVSPTVHLYGLQADAPGAPPFSVRHSGLFLDTPSARWEPPSRIGALGD